MKNWVAIGRVQKTGEEVKYDIEAVSEAQAAEICKELSLVDFTIEPRLDPEIPLEMNLEYGSASKVFGKYRKRLSPEMQLLENASHPSRRKIPDYTTRRFIGFILFIFAVLIYIGCGIVAILAVIAAITNSKSNFGQALLSTLSIGLFGLLLHAVSAIIDTLCDIAVNSHIQAFNAADQLKATEALARQKGSE